MLTEFLERVFSWKCIDRVSWTSMRYIWAITWQVAVPSRTDVREYQELKEMMDKLVGQINGRWEWQHFLLDTEDRYIKLQSAKYHPSVVDRPKAKWWQIKEWHKASSKDGLAMKMTITAVKQLSCQVFNFKMVSNQIHLWVYSTGGWEHFI